MSGYTFMPPPVLTGAAQEQIRQLSSYLYRMNENLNVALNSLSPENFTEAARQTLGGAGSVTMEIVQSQYNALVSMIRAVEQAMSLLEQELQGYIDEEIAKIELPVDGEVTEGGANAVSGAAVYAFTAQEVAEGGEAPVSGAAVAAYVAQEIGEIDLPEVTVDSEVTEDGANAVSGAAVAAYVADYVEAELAKIDNAEEMEF